ncbi:cytochrome P450 [Dacryopinax primogenitus]|uniref:Cytochrome P450 n=1 Tax=Dacryopinax primogenitus (strain DJM 731) TaxID=1858805 RepID=M5FMZ2_DACPD|nr:cytochrome P450 [Dacryopinax primogenitus]EJT96540.1 cytochrome P450 [Dacryopinax primogenitus]
MMIEGHTKFKGKPFQLPTFRSWMVFVSRELFDDIRKARDEGLSFKEQVNEAIAVEYTIGKALADDPWHVSVIRKQMTQNLGAKFPEIYEEISQAFADELKFPNSGDWMPVNAYELILRVVCRTSNRLFVGLPLCRNEEFTKMSCDYTTTVIRAGFFIAMFPGFLKPLVARWLSAAPAATKGFERFLLPVIEERIRKEEELGESWNDQKPFDFLQWMIDAADGKRREPKELNKRMLAMNFTATHTSSMSFTHAFYWLAAYPQYVPELRQEIEFAIKEHGWTRDAIDNMFKADSFIKEAMRLTGLGVMSMARKSMRPFTLSDGTVIPTGSRIAVNAWSIHHDPDTYEKPEEFDPFRFSRRIEQGESIIKNAFTTSSSSFVFWGAGTHVCAGRYFASQELKAMLAYVVMNFDVKMPNDGERPADVWFGAACIPDPKATVLFRKRAG